MVALTGVAPHADTSHVPIETMRSMAVVLLVAYHVIGSGAGTGLDIAYPNVLRLYADFFLDVRMPFFAFIAGYVYALRPLNIRNYVGFATGKFRRLMLPGLIAIAAFMTVAHFAGTRFAMPLQDIWRPFVQAYAHFWFLQSIMVIFLCYGLLDAVLRGRFAVVALACSVLVYIADWRFPTTALSVNGAVYLLPYYLLGVAFCRHTAEIWEEAERLTLLLLVVALACAFWNIRELIETGTFSRDTRDVQSLVFGLSVCALAFLWCPRLPILEQLAPFALTIYLYHVFGTVAARMVANGAGIASTDLRFIVGLAGGLTLPIGIHLVVQRIPVLSMAVLGRR